MTHAVKTFKTAAPGYLFRTEVFRKHRLNTLPDFGFKLDGFRLLPQPLSVFALRQSATVLAAPHIAVAPQFAAHNGFVLPIVVAIVVCEKLCDSIMEIAYLCFSVK